MYPPKSDGSCSHDSTVLPVTYTLPGHSKPYYRYRTTTTTAQRNINDETFLYSHQANRLSHCDFQGAAPTPVT